MIGLLGSVMVAMGVLSSAQRPPQDGKDFLLRVGAPIAIAAGDSVGAAVVFGDDATVDGRVAEGLVVINGRAKVNGVVGGNLVVVNGTAELGPAASIGGDLVLYRSTVTGTTTSAIKGRTVVENGLSFGRGFLIWWWLGCTVALTAAAALFVAIGSGTLGRAVRVLERRSGGALLGAVATFGGLPALAFFAFTTVIGFLLGVGILAVVLPALWTLGYLVIGTWFGRFVLRFLRAKDSPERPYGAATLGVLALQLVGLVPVVGGLAVCVGGVIGAGALASLAWETWRGEPTPVSPGVVAPAAT